MSVKSFLCAVFVCVVAFPAMACSPCAGTLSLEETIAAAELVVLAERTDYKEGEVSATEPSGPEFIRVRVLKTLKGTAPDSELNVHSWYGMCPYGIYLGNKMQAVIYLVKKEDAFDSVGSGCAQQTNDVVDGQVQVRDKKIPMDEFIATYIK
jgi:hypothetical protein